ncbi:MAG: HEPN domain-containing protein [Cellulosilyticaceae bacterium]
MKGLYKLAKTDLLMAKNNLALLEDIQDEIYLNYIAYHVQQSVEKMLKLQVELLGEEYPRSHNIAVLVDRCLDLGVDIPELIQDYDVIITEWATGTRYDSSFVTSKRQLQKVIACLDTWFESLGF